MTQHCENCSRAAAESAELRSMRRYAHLPSYGRVARRVLNTRLLPIAEQAMGSWSEKLHSPPVFIIGPPRSGSTLAIQVMAEALDIGYISNRHCDWYGCPALAEWLFRPSRQRPPGDFQSEHGATIGNHAPAECGRWWARFFAHGTPPRSHGHGDVRRFARSVALLSRAMGRPIVFKNLYASLRIPSIVAAFPKCLFIIMERNELDIAQSLLAARFASHGNYQSWFSVEPPDHSRLQALSPAEQVIGQIRSIYAQLRCDLSCCGVTPERYIRLRYEDLCGDPEAAVRSVQSLFQVNEVRVTRRVQPLQPFVHRQSVHIDPAVYAELQRVAAQVDPSSDRRCGK